MSAFHPSRRSALGTICLIFTPSATDFGRRSQSVYLWRAVDAEGEVLDVLVQSRRNKRAALKLMRKLLKKYGFVPDKLITDDLRSYAAAASDLGIAKRHELY